MRKIPFLLLCAVALFGSFFVTVWLTAPKTEVAPPAERDPSTAAADLAARPVASVEELPRAAAAAGLRLSWRLQGRVDSLARINEREVTMNGWLADPEGDGMPLTVLVFVGGSAAGMGQTKGERPDVTQAMHLGFGAEKNVAFALNFACGSGVPPVVVGIGAENQYVRMETGRCP